MELHRHLEELRARYTDRAHRPLSYPGFYLRFTPELVQFLRRCPEYAMDELDHELGRELDSRRKPFDEDLTIGDHAVVRLHVGLAKKWPTTRSRKVAAGVKVDAFVGVCASGPRILALVGSAPMTSSSYAWDGG